MKKTLLVLPLALAITACGGNKPKPVIEGDTEVNNQASTETTAPVATAPVSEGFSLECEPRCNYPKSALNDPNSMLSKRIIYFDFDSDAVKANDSNVLIAHAYYLASNPDVKVRLDGHTDERGSREYNLALGERRAKAVRKDLLANGAKATGITVNSYGEEQPAALGANEAAWSQNRRVEFIYQ